MFTQDTDGRFTNEVGRISATVQAEVATLIGCTAVIGQFIWGPLMCDNSPTVRFKPFADDSAFECRCPCHDPGPDAVYEWSRIEQGGTSHE